MANLKSKTRKCPTCKQPLPGERGTYTPRPLGLDSRFKRGLSSIRETLRLIEDQRGRSAARSALAKLTRDLALDE